MHHILCFFQSQRTLTVLVHGVLSGLAWERWKEVTGKEILLFLKWVRYSKGDLKGKNLAQRENCLCLRSRWSFESFMQCSN